jgi:hypothetical protein
MSESISNSPSANPLFEERLQQINTILSEWLRGKKIIFDQASSYQITDRTKQGEGLFVELDDFKTLETKYLAEFGQEGVEIEGSCQKLTPILAGKLKQLGLIDDFEYVIDDQVYHHVALVVTIHGQRALIDVARRKPIPVIIPLDDQEVISSFYTGNPNISYTASEDSAEISVSVKDPSRTGESSRKLKFRKLKDEKELKEIAIEALKQNTKLTRAEVGPDGRFQRVSIIDTEQGKLRIAVLNALEDGILPVYMKYGAQNLGRINEKK